MFNKNILPNIHKTFQQKRSALEQRPPCGGADWCGSRFTLPATSTNSCSIPSPTPFYRICAVRGKKSTRHSTPSEAELAATGSIWRAVPLTTKAATSATTAPSGTPSTTVQGTSLGRPSSYNKTPSNRVNSKASSHSTSLLKILQFNCNALSRSGDPIFNEYVLYRKDRMGGRSGGLLMLIHHSIPFVIMQLPEIDTPVHHCASIADYLDIPNLILLGDLNAHDEPWHSSNLRPTQRDAGGRAKNSVLESLGSLKAEKINSKICVAQDLTKSERNQCRETVKAPKKRNNSGNRNMCQECILAKQKFITNRQYKLFQKQSRQKKNRDLM
ncbi:hypothetical protein HELRODRAFT_158805 [Helobdella robusta]|uniref:Endonuclease/exonuclease/phosphatase domain-containing protein n=1 Tax=Helobdella robusta TaxID=6412 RepID=T1ENA2_HELRO|nr:hypothetical protein HELRODRAFT_158805 [Helobdella robusta]ESO12313.1 hypothetical protein HELRODRAFT_158805 [Helobdella robusta]